MPDPRTDATGLAAAIVRGALSAREALERTLAAIEARNPTLNAVCLLDAELGFAAASRLDGERAACRDEPARAALLARKPFFGVPLLLKDIGAATAHPGLPTRAGSRLFGDGERWTVMGELARRYAAAGFVAFGRTTTPEMGISVTTEAVAYGGPTRNPWNTAHSAGGSSGGAGAAVASRMVTIAHASDGAGSIRIPASACGLIGLKPSRGLVPMGPLAGEGWGGLTSEHVLARTVRDCAAALDVSAGADAGAPYAAPARPPSFRHAAEQPPRRLTIGVVDTFFEGDPVDAEVAVAVRAFADRLAGLGHRVEAARVPFATLDVLRPVVVVAGTGTARVLEEVAEQRSCAIDATVVELSIQGALRYARGLRATDYLGAIDALHGIGRRMAEFHAHYDLLLTPVLAEPPAVLGRFAMTNPDFLDYRLGPNGIWRYSPFTPLANATGAPSIALPAGRSRTGLPIGAMLGAPPGADALLLQVAAEWERDAGPLELP
jgi:amidase